MNILAVGAHPDDIEFGCAHVLIQEVRKGNHVKLLVLSRGEAGTNGTPEARESEARAAAKLIGADIDFLDFGGDCHLLRSPENAFKLAVEIRKIPARYRARAAHRRESTSRPRRRRPIWSATPAASRATEAWNSSKAFR